MDDFNRLSEGISYLRNKLAINTPKEPSIIVLCSWMGAAPKHVAKYAHTWRTLYPNSEVIVIQCSMGTILRYTKRKSLTTNLAQVSQILQSHLPSSSSPGTTNTKPPAVLHLFSNGGTFTSSTLLTLLPEATRLQLFRATIIDSAPGEIGYSKTINAMVAALPTKSAFIKLLLTPVMHFIYCLSLVVIYVFRRKKIVAEAIARLNDGRYLDKARPRLYLYSDADQMMPAEVVERHVGEAKGKGFEDVRCERFVGSAHCQHAVVFGERYWGAVRGVVES